MKKKSDEKNVYAIPLTGEWRHRKKIGVARLNEDGSIDVRLTALPIDEIMRICDRPARKAKGK